MYDLYSYRFLMQIYTDTYVRFQERPTHHPPVLETCTQVSSLQAQAKEEVAADHTLELKYQQQAEEYQKDVEQLALWP